MNRVWRRGLFALIALLFAGIAFSVTATDHFVSPTGTTSTAVGTGTITTPWALKTALAQPAAVKPGDTIWLRGGTYPGKYVSYLTGTSTAPIVVRPYPGEWAKIDSGSGNPSGLDILQVNGAYAWYWGFEIMSSDPRRQSTQNGSWPTDITRGGCASTNTGQGVGVKFINLICHDAAAGISPWADSSNAEVYGNLIYYNGWNGATDRGHGHGIYAQNDAGSKLLMDNIMFGSYDIGMQVYGSDSAGLVNFTIQGNFVFGSGLVSGYGGVTNLVFGGGSVATNGQVLSNVFFTPDGQGDYEQIGYDAGVRPAVVQGNYFSPGSPIALQYVDTLDVLTMTGNFFWGMVLNDSSKQITYSAWPGNTFVPYTSRPTGTNIVVRPNKYEAGRGHIAVLNWGLASTVAVDVSNILVVGASYEVRNAQNFFGPPVLSGVYAGGTITLPMTGLTPAVPVGGTAQPSTGPEFNAFVVRTVTGGVTPPPASAFTFGPAAPQTGAAVTFTDASTGGPTSWQWSFGDGGTSTLRNPTHAYAVAGTYAVTLTASNAGGSSQTTRQVVVTAPPVSSAPTGFHILTLCRVIDTRKPNGAVGGPALAANRARTFPVAGACGIPSNAIAVSVNSTVIGPSARGNLQIYPGNTAPPLTSAVSFSAGRTSANNGIVVLATDGRGTIGVNNNSAGTADFVLDVNGYYK